MIVSNPFIVADAPNERQAALICDACAPMCCFFIEAGRRERNPCTVRSCLRQQCDAPNERIMEAKIAAACCSRSLIRSCVRERVRVTRCRGSVIESRYREAHSTPRRRELAAQLLGVLFICNQQSERGVTHLLLLLLLLYPANNPFPFPGLTCPGSSMLHRFIAALVGETGGGCNTLNK